MRRLLLVFTLQICVTALWAQLPPNQPEQDCINAIPICQNVFNQPLSYQGIGANTNEINGGSSCLNDPFLQGENNSVWYSFTAQTTGDLCFLITPTNPFDNYDWAVYDITNTGCNGIFTNPNIEIACNNDGGTNCAGATGPSGNNTSLCFGTQEENCIQVFQGRTYVIAVNNQSGTATGHSINFSASTAVILDSNPPAIASATFDCANSRITLRMDENIDCNSVDPFDFTLTGPGGPYTVTSVNGVRCGTDPTERQFDLTITPGFQGNGTYTVSISDTVMDNCGNMAILGSGVNFNIRSVPPTTRFATNFCSNNTLRVKLSSEVLCSSVSSTDFRVTGNGGPYTVTNAQTIGGCLNGRTDEVLLQVTPPFPSNGFYTAHLDGTVIDSCGNASIPDSVTAFVQLPIIRPIAAPDTVCIGSPVTLDAGITGPFRYQWTPANVRAKVATVFPTVSTTYTIIATDTTTFCNYTGSVNVVVKPVPQASFSVTSPICASQTAIINFTGQAPPGTVANWDLDGGIVTQGDTTGVNPISLQWNTPGVKTLTLELENDGCFSNVFTTTVTVFRVPSASFSFSSPVCVDDSVTLTYTGNAIAGSSYIWQFAGGASYPSANGQQGPYNVSWSRPGTKTVCMQVQENGCVSNLVCRQIDVLPPPTASIAAVPDLCFEGGTHAVNFQYNGTPGVTTYDWFFGATANLPTASGPTPPPITYATPGQKTAKVVVARNGCISDTASVTFNVLPEPDAGFVINTAGGTVCASDTIRVQRTGQSVSPSEVYVWNFGRDAIPARSNLPTPGPIIYGSGGTKVITLTVRHGPGCVDSFAQTIVVEDIPTFTAGQDIRYCEGTGGGQLNATTSGGFGSYTWLWTCDAAPSCGLSSSIVEDPFVNPTGIAPDTITYFGYATDAKGCRSKTDRVQVIIDAKPKVDAGPDLSICEDGPGVNLQGGLQPSNRAPGPFTWEWRDDQGNVPPAGMTLYQQPIVYTRPLNTTLYTLVVTDQSTGCTSEVTTIDTFSTALVRVIPEPVANAGPDTVMCFGDTITLRGSGSGGEGRYTYSWTPDNPLVGYMNSSSDAEPEISPFQTTTYTLVVTASGCTSESDDVNVVVHTVPTVEAGDDKVICFGDTAILDGSASGAPQNGVGYSFNWTPSLGLSDPTDPTPMASPRASQVYQLEVSSDFGCGSDVDDMLLTVLPVPIVEVTVNDTTICEGESVVLEGRHFLAGPPPANPNVIYEWFPGSQIDGTNRAPRVVGKPSETTEYILTTTLGPCSTEDRVLVAVSPAVDATISASDTVICSGESVTLTAVGGFGNSTYLWSPSAGIADTAAEVTLASPITTTTYQLQLSEGACSDETTLTIEVNPTPVADYFASETDGCEGLEVSFLENATDGITYVWDFGDGSPLSNVANPIHTFSSAGSYPVTLTVVGEGGCADSITKSVINISGGPGASFTSEPALGEILYLPNAEVAFLNRSENAVAYAWDFGDGNYSKEENPVHQYQQPGLYQVVLTATDAKGCVSVDSVGPYEVRVPDLRIPNIFTPNGDGFNDEFQVIYEGGENFQIEVFDRWGKRYFETTNPNEYWRGTNAKGNEAPEGVYYYAVVIGDNAYTGNVTLLR